MLTLVACVGIVSSTEHAQDADYEYIEAVDPEMGNPLICFTNGVCRYWNSEHEEERKVSEKRDHWNRLRRASMSSYKAIAGQAMPVEPEWTGPYQSFPLVKKERPTWAQMHKKAQSWSRLKKDASWSRLKKDASWSRL